jgi:rhodanese-related sulfurtransferase
VQLAGKTAGHVGLGRREFVGAGLLAAAGGLGVWGTCARAGEEAQPTPPPAADPDPDSPFGIDRNVNMATIDAYIGRSDLVFRDARLVRDPADYAQVGGSSTLDFVLEGFKLVPYPYLGTVAPLPVAGRYDGPSLFDVTWNDDATQVVRAQALYEESQTIVDDLFPRDRPVLVMCGAGGYAAMTCRLLTYLGWDLDLLYNVGGAWDYTGYHAVETMRAGAEGAEPRMYLWRADIATIDFDQLHAL